MNKESRNPGEEQTYPFSFPFRVFSMPLSALCGLGLSWCLCALVVPSVSAQALYTPEERANLVAFWNAPGRYSVRIPQEAKKNGVWQVRLTPEASVWFLKYQVAIGAAKAPPTQDPATFSSPANDWKAWVNAKLAYDRWQAQRIADEANAALRLDGAGRQTETTALQGTKSRTEIPPPPPGLIPADLQAAAGDPPAFATAVTPMEHAITFEDGETYVYTDHVKLPPSYAYYRFPQGTVAYGKLLKAMPDSELDPLFVSAGFSPSEQRIAKAVSKLEGGFETVNTYDTGYVSIGFIQFITYDTGQESLLEVMAREKADQPADYARDFRAYGIEVNAAGTLVVVDPATGAELVGNEAVRKLVEEKRLTAVFQRAGRHSTAFRVAQIRTAKTHYWPAEDRFSVLVGGTEVPFFFLTGLVHWNVGGQLATGKVSDVVKSEAGLATLFDRKVNRGSVVPFPAVLAKVMSAHGVTRFAEAARYEREIIAALKYRTDFLSDQGLSQPE